MRVNLVSAKRFKAHRVRKFLGFLLLLALVASFLIFVISTTALWRLEHPSRVSVKAFTSNIAPEFTNASFKDSLDEIPLKGWYFESKGSDRTVVLVHGYGKNRLQFEEKSLDMIKVLLTKRYNVLAFDLRDSGESGGNKFSGGVLEKNDVLGAVRYVKSKGAKHIILMGFSTGATACILAAAENTDVKAVVSDTALADLGNYMKESFHRWSRLPEIPFNRAAYLSVKLLGGTLLAQSNLEKAMAAVAPKPVLLIHSEIDSLFPVSQSVRLQKAYPVQDSSGMTLWKTQAAGHLGSYGQFPQQYMDKVTEFLESAFKSK